MNPRPYGPEPYALPPVLRPDAIIIQKHAIFVQIIFSNYKNDLLFIIFVIICHRAGVAELADAQVSGTCESNLVGVQVSSSAPFFLMRLTIPYRAPENFYFWEEEKGSERGCCKAKQKSETFDEQTRKFQVLVGAIS